LLWCDPKTYHLTCTAKDPRKIRGKTNADVVGRKAHRGRHQFWRINDILICNFTCTTDDLRKTTAEVKGGKAHYRGQVWPQATARHRASYLVPPALFQATGSISPPGGQPTCGPTCGHHMWRPTFWPPIQQRAVSPAPRKIRRRPPRKS
jgi:hypothetical protein